MFMVMSSGQSHPLTFRTRMRIKFATSILFAIYIFRNYDIFLHIDNHSLYVNKFTVIFIFVVIILVQFCVNLVRNYMFYIKKISNLVTIFFIMS